MRRDLLILCFVAWGGTVQGGTILSDAFGYLDGNLAQVSGGFWQPYNNLGGTAISVTQGKIRLLGSGSSEDDCAPLTGAPYLVADTSVALYSRYSLVISNSLPTVSGTYISCFKGTNTGSLADYGARVWVSTCDGITTLPLNPGVFRIGVGNGASAHAGSGQIHRDLSTNTVYTVVTRFVPSTGVATVWLDPVSESDPGVSASDLGTAQRANRFDVFAYAFQQNTGGGTVYIDQLRIGTAFSDVVGLNTAPTISAIAGRSTPAGVSTGPIPFTVEDAESAPGALVVTASSSNRGLVPDGNLGLGGAGANRTITAVPLPGKQGTTVITVKVSDGVNESFTTFPLEVGFPWISNVPSQNVLTNQAVPAIHFTVGDAESSAEALFVGATSSNPTLLPDSGILLGGTGVDRLISLVPVPAAVGTTRITLTVSDGINSASTSFDFTVSPGLGLLFSDDFLYTDFVQPNSLWLAAGSPWQTVSGTAAQTQVTNGWVYLTRSDSEDLAAPLRDGPYSPASAVVFYTSFKVQFSELPSRGGSYFLHLKNSEIGTIFRCRVFACTTNAGSGFFRLGVANAGSVPATYSRDLALQTNYTVVTRYNSATGESALWVDPLSEHSECVVATDLPASDIVGHIGLRQYSGMGTLALSALKVGTSFSDVLDHPQPGPAPEPLRFQRVSGQIILTWIDPRFSLATSTSAAGPFVKVPAATSPYAVPSATSQRFYRLVYP
jgi:hypothetical protein